MGTSRQFGQPVAFLGFVGKSFLYKNPNSWMLHNALYYHPIGDSPWLAGNAMDSFFALPLTLVFGWPLSANLYTLLLFFAVGMVGFYLGNRLRYSFWGSVFLGCTLQSSTYLLQHANAGRFSQLNIVFLLLGIALFLDVFMPISKTST